MRTTERQTESGRSRLTDEEFRTLMREASAEARRLSLGEPPGAEPDFALRTQHAEFGAAAH
ncbi:hypothetical protein GCM10010497_13050 [Streptomyces cinereoruber]|uniref:Uncharacterized protein n=1 Tax=Streptomyces cinereoruber TaxID=67260 RepID=A0AAV4KF01_9ACTN|nr:MULTISPECIES: hypothetical protein [Streptomyces]AVH93907.1 hypothetical protein C5L38_01555 [Streptomyces sp. WAC00288]KYG51666.1 hypothetical protein AWI43_30170 [Streptomyces sp. WAC04657]MBB4162013.1 hypothetical protein [Streptomyces cinereoruber]MBY8819508.1 hypothetical protein [Streptomyces cinereoruber]NIH63745.1 hypothetical protein [Streptomyces cinereoruber]